MNKEHILSNYFNTQSLGENLWGFLGDIAITSILALILSMVYVKFGNSLSNRKSLSGNFVLLALTTMLIITIVKSSLALSLGLVGALSIVRFRAAIKEPEELTYLFLAISLGLGFGANQRYITIIAFVAIILIIMVKSLFTRSNISYSNLFVSLSSKTVIPVEKIAEMLKEHTSYVSLKRLDESENKCELLFLVNFDNISNLAKFKEKVQKQDGNMEISFFEDKGVFN
jgi:hypothetical protein